jgi:hypothetical protein
LLSQIAGMDVETIRRGRQELVEELASRDSYRFGEISNAKQAFSPV